jgi:nucleotide-binding universal stress UspA family protein
MTHASRGHAWLQLAPRTGGSAGPHRRTFRDLRPFTAGGSFGPSWTPGLAPERSEELRAEATGRVRAWTAPVDQVGARVRVEVDDGDPVDVLLPMSEREHADLLVVGTRGAGGFAGLHLGNVAHHLAHHATRPLAIVPAREPTSRPTRWWSASMAPRAATPR